MYQNWCIDTVLKYLIKYICQNLEGKTVVYLALLGQPSRALAKELSTELFFYD
jgi:hypothetical protein